MRVKARGAVRCDEGAEGDGVGGVYITCAYGGCCEACRRKYATRLHSYRRAGVRAEIFIDFGSGNYAPQNEAAPVCAPRHRGNLSV